MTTARATFGKPSVQAGLVAGLAISFVFCLFYVLSRKSALYAAAAPVGLVVSGVIVLVPFAGLWTIALFTQLDALAGLISQHIPISVIKLLTMLTLGGVILNSFREKRRERLGPDSMVIRLGVLFGCVLMLSYLFVESEWLGRWSLRRLLSLVVLLYLTVRLTTSVDRVKAICLAIVASTGISAMVVMYDWVFGGSLLGMSSAATTATAAAGAVSRSAGASDYNPTTSAAMMLTGTTMALLLMMRTKRWLWLTIPTAALGTAGIILSFARSAGIALAFALLWLLIKLRHDRRLPLVLMTGLLISGAVVPFVPPTYWERLSTLTDFNADRTLWRRFGYNLIGVELLVQHPILGVGPGNFQKHYTDQEWRYIPGRQMYPRQLHNMYLEVAVENGLLGFACFAGMLFVALRGMYRVYRRGPPGDELALFAEATHFAFVAFLITCLFMPSEYNKYTWLLMGMGSAMERLMTLRAAEPDAPEAG